MFATSRRQHRQAEGNTGCLLILLACRGGGGLCCPQSETAEKLTVCARALLLTSASHPAAGGVSRGAGVPEGGVLRPAGRRRLPTA